MRESPALFERDWPVERLGIALRDDPVARRRRDRRRDDGRIGVDHEARLAVQWTRRRLARLDATLVGDLTLSVSGDGADDFIRNRRRWIATAYVVIGGRSRFGEQTGMGARPPLSLRTMEASHPADGRLRSDQPGANPGDQR